MTDQPSLSKGKATLPKQTPNENILKSEHIQADRKDFVFTLKKNRRGCFLRISEQAGCHRNNVIIPAAGLGELRRILDDMLKLPDV
jgi:hypothetical protein